jgi:hypothetical protein
MRLWICDQSSVLNPAGAADSGLVCAAWTGMPPNAPNSSMSSIIIDMVLNEMGLGFIYASGWKREEKNDLIVGENLTKVVLYRSVLTVDIVHTRSYMEIVHVKYITD